MKDAYSFDLTDAGLARSYDTPRGAYQRIFARLGLDHTIVAAMSGAMGGSASEEFLATSGVGEDTFVGCTSCDYAANTEAVVTPVPVLDPVDRPPLTVHDTPDTPTIDSLVKGYIGPPGGTIRYLADPRIAPGTAWLTGANQPGKHATSVVAGRDFTPDGTIEAAEVRAGDPCPRCGGRLTIRRGIEIAHIFQLGRRYTDAFQVDVQGADGKPVRPTMGCYGIGVSRAVAAIAEQHHDDRGLIWPASVAPADVHVIAAGKGGQIEAALTLAGDLAARGVRVLVDDRPQLSAGVKFTDAELIGIPRAVVVGRRLSDGYAELRDRRTGDRREVPMGVIAAELGYPGS